MWKITLDDLIAQIYKEKIVPEGAITKLDEEKATMITKEGYTFMITTTKTEFVGSDGKVEAPPDLQEADVKFKLDPEGWSNTNIKITI